MTENDYGNFKWDVKVTDDKIEGYVFMNNYDFYDYLIKIGIPDSAIEMEY